MFHHDGIFVYLVTNLRFLDEITKEFKILFVSLPTNSSLIPLNYMNKRITLAAALLAASDGHQRPEIHDCSQGGKMIGDKLIGIFFEDISSAADGGLYAELVQNGSFEFNPAERDGWGAGTALVGIRPGHPLGYLQVRMDNGLNANNPTYMRLHTERANQYYDYTGWTGFGIQNDGFDGISVKAGEKYDFRSSCVISAVPRRCAWPYD